MPYAQREAVLQRVADSLHVPVNQLASEWESIASQATKDAAADLTSILAMKGYSGPQITQGADQFAVWQERLAAYYSLMRGAALASYDLKAVETLDPRKMIQDLGAILINGVPVAPGPSEVGGIGYGRVQAVADLESRYRCR